MSQITVTMVATGSTIWKCDTIRHEGGIWLVPAWFEHDGKGYMTPARIIRIDGLPHQETPDNPEYQRVLKDPLPEGLVTGAMPPSEAEGLQVIDAPDIRMPVGNS